MLGSINFSHHSISTVGRCPGAPANDFFDAFLVDCCIAFWIKETTKYCVYFEKFKAVKEAQK